jgi:cathepsin L
MFAKSFLLFCVFVFSVAARPTWRELDNYTFDQFLNDFGFEYPSEEIEMRRNLFISELSRVRQHNAKNLSWKEGINKFSCLTTKEKQSLFGRSKAHAAKSKNLKHAKSLPENFKIEPIASLPTTADWRKAGIVSSVKDQGYCGSCWAFAATAVIESHVAIQTGKLFDLSVQQTAMCAPNPDSCGGTGGCAGSTAELAFNYVASSKGLFEEYQYSYAAYYGQNSACATPKVGKPVATLSGFVQLPENNYTALLNAANTVGPIAVSVDASKWSAYESGVFNGCNQASPDIDHAVILMGYGEEINGQKYWLIRNSWAASWGELGYIRLARSDSDESLCGLDVTPQDGTACAGQTDAVKVCGTCGVLYDSAYPLL